ncbi:outer membrane beta-barrel protein [Variovorax sp. VNK109]|uniref:outer membrane beta-barrel protein n=1 Tax=Variovorax sp. VNK109 TaxID=3400919 RepID=UPI003BFF5015
MNFKYSTLALITVLSLGATSAFAQTKPATDIGWYAGGSIGKAGNKLRTDNIDVEMTGTEDTSGTGFKIYGGYKFNENFAAELQYHDLKKYSYTESETRYGTLRVKGIAISALGILPLTPEFAVFGKVGIASQNLSGFATDGWSSGSLKTNKAAPLLGIGGEYAINRNLAVRAEYEYMGVPTFLKDGDQKVKFRSDMFSIGLNYRF